MSENSKSPPMGQAEDDRPPPAAPIPITPEVEHTNVLMASENVNNENREKELQLGEENSADDNNDDDDEVGSDANPIAVQTNTDQDEAPPQMENVLCNDENYVKHVTYNESGEAVYTDPSSKVKFKWDAETNSWVPCEQPDTKSAYENEHYKWDAEKNEWVPKDKGNLETEFFKWDLEAKQWIPKIQVDDVTRGFEDGVHTYTDGEGVVYFWDTDKNEWFPKVDEYFLAKYQMSYGFVDNTTPEEPNVEKEPVESVSKSSGVVATESGEKNTKRKGGNKDPPSWFDLPPEQNTKVYVSQLPDDMTEKEFIELMSKYGMIAKDLTSGKFKVRLYTDSDGQFKGDALCNYIKVESVDLAINLLDGSDVRGRKIKVELAEFQMRGDYNPALKPKRRKKDKEREKKHQQKLFDWRPDRLKGERASHERHVIIKNLFETSLFDNEVHLILEYQKDLQEECSKYGAARKVIIYDRNPEGVAQISMADPEEADLVVHVMNGRMFCGRKLVAEIWDGKTKYKVVETEKEVEERLNNWDKFLTTEEEKAAPTTDETSKADPN